MTLAFRLHVGRSEVLSFLHTSGLKPVSRLERAKTQMILFTHFPDVAAGAWSKGSGHDQLTRSQVILDAATGEGCGIVNFPDFAGDL
jgi:hypothetical protein